METFTSAAAIVLAGGNSSRIDTPKFLLDFAGEPLIARLVRRVASLFMAVVVVSAPVYELRSLPVHAVYDELPFQ